MSAQPAPPPMFPNTLLAGATRQHLKSASRERSLLATYLLGRTFYFLEDKETSGICMLKSLLPTLASIQMLKDCDASKQSSVQSKILICYGGKNTTSTPKSKGSKAKKKQWALASDDNPFPECSYVPGPGALLVGDSEDITAVRIKPKRPTRMGPRPKSLPFPSFPIRVQVLRNWAVVGVGLGQLGRANVDQPTAQGELSTCLPFPGSFCLKSVPTHFSFHVCLSDM